MKLRSLFPVIAIHFVLALWAAYPVSAGTIIVSGDGNIANALDGSVGVTLDPDNQQFFTNVLQGGTQVLVQSTTGAPSPSISVADEAMNDFYNSLSGVTSSLIAGPITSAALAGVDLFAVVVPDSAYTVAETVAFGGFLSNGGTLLLLGENSSFSTQNGFINTLLGDLGSTLRIVDDSLSNAFPLAHPLTASVGPMTYDVGSQVTGGTTLFVNTGQLPLIAVDSVPEPTTLALFGLGLAGLGAVRRKKLAA